MGFAGPEIPVPFAPVPFVVQIPFGQIAVVVQNVAAVGIRIPVPSGWASAAVAFPSGSFVAKIGPWWAR